MKSRTDWSGQFFGWFTTNVQVYEIYEHRRSQVISITTIAIYQKQLKLAQGRLGVMVVQEGGCFSAIVRMNVEYLIKTVTMFTKKKDMAWMLS